MNQSDDMETERQALQDSKAATLQELGIFIAKSAFALNSAAAVALIPLAGAVLRSEQTEVLELASTLAAAGWWFITGTLVALVVAGRAHFKLMHSWMLNKPPEGDAKARARRASFPVLGFALPALPFLGGVSVILCGLADLSTQ